MNHYDYALMQYYIEQGADKKQIGHIFHNQQKWK